VKSTEYGIEQNRPQLLDKDIRARTPLLMFLAQLPASLSRV
jgi:hypothetical protein